MFLFTVNCANNTLQASFDVLVHKKKISMGKLGRPPGVPTIVRL